jgi:DNA repair exonuclease SbcCD ATPase subunit
VRLESLEVEGFRSFSEKVSLDFSGDVILVNGANGTGKTSILDAVLWGLCGTLPRLKKAQDKVLSLYAKFGYAQVTLTLSNESTGLIRVSRRYDGTQMTLTLQEGNEQLVSRKGENRLLELLWPVALSSEKSFETLANVLTHCVYLQQDLVRGFIESESDIERFQALSELVGAGRITELQKQLESARLAWSRAITQREADVEVTRRQLEQVRQQIDRRGASDSELVSSLADSWQLWWGSVGEIGLAYDAIPPIESAEASVSLDAILRRIQTETAASSRRIATLDALDRDFESLQTAPPRDEEISDAELQLTEVREKWKEVNFKLADAQTKAAEERRRLIDLRESQESLKSLASLALRHLGENCPVCSQAYDELTTRERLERLASGQEMPASEAIEAATVNALSNELSQTQAKLSVAEAHYRQLVEKRNEYLALQQSALRQLASFNITPPEHSPLSATLRSARTSLTERDRRYRDLYSSGEQLSLALSRLSEQLEKGKLQQELTTLERAYQEQKTVYDSYAEVRQTATQMIDALREVGAVAVGSQIKQIEPLLDRIYARIVPHPAFTRTSLFSKYTQGKGRMDVLIEDPVGNVKKQDPLGVLSSSQLNALAFSVFLSFNLATSSIPLEMAVLDDPLQSLDDVNLLGLVDVLRRARGKRQLLISTHDERFSQLLMRKLRPIESNQKTKVITLQSWTRNGPELTSSEVPFQSQRHSILTA